MSQPLDNFSQGLLALNLDPCVVKETWKYAGGNNGSHARYLDLLDISITSEYTTECVCGHHIVENCYICDPTETDVLTVGNCCIKRFMVKSGRTCSKCDEPHQNRNDNLCNECRQYRWCKEPKCRHLAEKYSLYCNLCVKKHPNKCKMCDKLCGTYQHCFKCNRKKKANNEVKDGKCYF